MATVYDLELPLVDQNDPTLVGRRLHDVLGDLAGKGWLARADIGFVVLERRAVIDVLRDRRLAFPALPLLGIQGIVDGPVFDRTAKGLMTRSGEPHLRLRRLVAPAFSPGSVARLRARLRTFLDQWWEEIRPARRVEFVTSLAQPAPAVVIADLLGAPDEVERLARWSIMLQAVFKLNMAEGRADVERAYEEVAAWVLDLLEARRLRPGPDFLSTIGTLEVEGDRLSDDECVTLAIAVISGGVDTTQAQLS